jgi:hypothetical protein
MLTPHHVAGINVNTPSRCRYHHRQQHIHRRTDSHLAGGLPRRPRGEEYRAYARVHVCMYMYMYVYMYVCIYIHVFYVLKQMTLPVCVYVHMYVFVYVCMYSFAF